MNKDVITMRPMLAVIFEGIAGLIASLLGIIIGLFTLVPLVWFRICKPLGRALVFKLIGEKGEQINATTAKSDKNEARISKLENDLRAALSREQEHLAQIAAYQREIIELKKQLIFVSSQRDAAIEKLQKEMQAEQERNDRIDDHLAASDNRQNMTEARHQAEDQNTGAD
jgi:hypothetical protein